MIFHSSYRCNCRVSFYFLRLVLLSSAHIGYCLNVGHIVLLLRGLPRENLLFGKRFWCFCNFKCFYFRFFLVTLSFSRALSLSLARLFVCFRESYCIGRLHPFLYVVQLLKCTAQKQSQVKIHTKKKKTREKMDNLKDPNKHVYIAISFERCAPKYVHGC